jgi:hypothetical protein
VNSILQELNYKTTKEDPSEMVYPSIAVIKEISEFDCIGENGQVKDQWDKVRDCFLVACFTGIRYNEFHDRQKIDIQERTYIKDGKKLKSFVMANTDDKTQSGINEVPCYQMLIAIIEKWKKVNFNGRSLFHILGKILIVTVYYYLVKCNKGKVIMKKINWKKYSKWAGVVIVAYLLAAAITNPSPSDFESFVKGSPIYKHAECMNYGRVSNNFFYSEYRVRNKCNDDALRGSYRFKTIYYKASFGRFKEIDVKYDEGD